LFIKLERYIRGRADWRRLRNAHYVVVSFGKSGRTWLRVMLSRYYQLRYSLPPNSMLIHDNLHLLNQQVPIFSFTHDNYLSDYTGNHRSKADYYDRSVILMVRDPRDTAVSQYFQWKHRMKVRKKVINSYPRQDVAMLDFLLDEAVGLPKIIRFMNDWAADLCRIAQHKLVRYEDLRTDTPRILCELLHFLGQDPTRDELFDCIEYASIENMRQLELSKAGQQLGGTRLQPGNASNPDSYKVRRAQVGGYRDYFGPGELTAIDSLVRSRLSPLFHYT
jgi:sulfotransferase family protein